MRAIALAIVLAGLGITYAIRGKTRIVGFEAICFIAILLGWVFCVLMGI